MTRVPAPGWLSSNKDPPEAAFATVAVFGIFANYPKVMAVYSLDFGGTALRLAIASLFAIGLAVPAFAQTEPPADFDEAAWQAEWDAGDTDGDGKLSREEAKAGNPNMTDEVFDQIDTDGDGFISPAEYKAALFEARGKTTNE